MKFEFEDNILQVGNTTFEFPIDIDKLGKTLGNCGKVSTPSARIFMWNNIGLSLSSAEKELANLQVTTYPTEKMDSLFIKTETIEMSFSVADGKIVHFEIDSENKK